jgi:hypothetical protein
MREKKRAAEANVGAFYGGVVQISLPIPAVGVEPPPGDPRPEDEWKVPTAPLDTEADVSHESMHSDSKVILPPGPTN